MRSSNNSRMASLRLSETVMSHHRIVAATHSKKVIAPSSRRADFGHSDHHALA